MKPRLNATRAVRELIKAYEPFVENAERRGRRWVIGWGHRATAREGATITPDNAELLLIYDALQAQQAVETVVGTELAKGARDALASFAASIGLSAFKVSDVARLAKAGRHREAAGALDSWVRAEVDGRLAVSDRLVERRRAEKTLFLDALAKAAESVEQPTEEPMLGVLVDVDTAFEDAPTIVEAAVIEDAVIEAQGQDAESGEEEASASTVSVEQDTATDTLVDETTADAEARAAIEATSPDTDDLPAAPEPRSPTEDDALKSQQDAAIKTVMARMAGDMASSVVAARPAEPAIEVPETADVASDDSADDAEVPSELDSESPIDLTDVKLGFSYLEPATVEVAVDEEPAAAEADDHTDPEAEAAPAEALSEPKPEPAPTPVYATVSVTTAPSTTAPPHPSLAPASAPGLSGESEGPDHPEVEDTEQDHDDDALDPAIVAGPEAGRADRSPQPQKSANWVFPAMLGVGVVMTGLGAWELASNWDAYLASGLDNSPIGPVVFGSGLLLTVGAGWMTLSRR